MCQYLEDFRLKDKWLHLFWQLLYDEIVGHPMTGLFDRCTYQFEVFLRFLVMAEVDFCCLNVWDKQTREMDTII